MPAALPPEAVETVKDVPATIAEGYKYLAEPCKVPADALVGISVITELPFIAGCVMVDVAAAAIVNEP